MPINGSAEDVSAVFSFKIQRLRLRAKIGVDGRPLVDPRLSLATEPVSISQVATAESAVLWKPLSKLPVVVQLVKLRGSVRPLSHPVLWMDVGSLFYGFLPCCFLLE